jgi:universal stress protein A
VPAGPVLFKEILCAVDFSDCSMDALDYAVSLAQEADGRLTIVHVLPNLEPDASVAGQYSTFAALQAEREEDARQRLDRAVPGPVTEYCRVESMVAHGKPSQEILRITSERQADLIVMGVQGRGAADRMFFGSTTQHVVREATCPVLTIRRQ